MQIRNVADFIDKCVGGGSVWHYSLNTMDLFFKAVLFLVIMHCGANTGVMGWRRCGGDSEESDEVGHMNCSIPEYTFGRYLHDMKYPSTHGRRYYAFGKDRVITKYCKVGSCFLFAQQKCVHPRKWRNECDWQSRNPILSS